MGMVGRLLLVGEQRGNEHALTGCREQLFIGFQGLGAYALAAQLLLQWQFGEALETGMGEGLERAFGTLAGQVQLSAQGAGIDLLGRLERVQRHLLQDVCGLLPVAQAQRLLGGGEAQ